MASLLDINAVFGPICPENLTKYGWEYDSVGMRFTKPIYNITIGAFNYHERYMVRNLKLTDIVYAVIIPHRDSYPMYRIIHEEDGPFIERRPEKTYEFYVQGINLGSNPYDLTSPEQVNDMGDIDMLFNKWRDNLLEAGVPEKYFINLE